MTAPWVAAFIALALAVIALTLFNIGLSQRVIALLSRLEQNSQVLGNETQHIEITGGLRHGAAAPPLPGTEPGSTIRASGALVVFVERDCNPCRVLIADLQLADPDLGDVERLAVVDHVDRDVSRLSSSWRIIHDSDGSIARSWQVMGTPAAYLLDAAGMIDITGHPNTVKDLKKLLGKRQNDHIHGHHLSPSGSSQHNE